MFLPYYFFILPYHFERQFNSRKWQNSPRYRWSMRESVVEYLDENQPNRDEVLKLLGEPWMSKEHFMIYWLRSNGVVGFDSDWIRIHFEEGSFVSSAIEHIE